MKFYTSNQLKRYILENVDETEIFAHYLDVPITEIYKAINNHNYRVLNNIRSEKNPSFGLQYYKAGGGIKLYGKDFGSPVYTGDCFHLAGMALGLHCNIPSDFVAICKDIIKRLINNDYNRAVSKHKTLKEKHTRTISISAIDIKQRNYTKLDVKYWLSYGIKPETLLKEKIYAIDKFYLNAELQDYQYEETNPAYAYYLGNNPNKLWEIYRPFEDKSKKFRTNSRNDIKELYTIKKLTNLILTKSKKDKALISQILLELGIKDTGVLYTSESNRLKQQTRNLLNDNYKSIFVNFDLDSTGTSSMKYFNQEYHYKVFPFTNDKMINSINNHPKDITDFCKRFGYDMTLKVFDYLYTKYVIL